jgi:hypothetical protein
MCTRLRPVSRETGAINRLLPIAFRRILTRPSLLRDTGSTYATTGI